MKDMANESDLAVSSLDEAMRRMSMGLEFKLETWKTWPLSFTMTSSLPEGEKAAHCMRLPSLVCRPDGSVRMSLRCPSLGWIKTGVPDCVHVVIQTKLSSPPAPCRKLADETPLSSDS